MRRIISYLLVAVAFLVTIVCINGLKALVERYEHFPKQVQNAIGQQSAYYNRSFSTHLPLLVIETGKQQIAKDREIWAEVSEINHSTKNNHLNDRPEYTAVAMIKYRGSSSYLTFDKKQYRIEFREEYGKEKSKNYAVMGMGEASDWVLNGPFLDRSLVRNRLVYSVSKELFSWSPNTRYCEVFLNGEYQGLYLMIEPATNEESRLNLFSFGLVSGRTAYLLKRDLSDTEDHEIDSYGAKNNKTSYQLSISYPTSRRLTKKQYQWIEQDISQFERILYSDKFDDPKLGYAAYIDVQSFVDYYIVNELTLTTDAGYLSTLVYKDIGGKLKTTVWDFNNSFNNYQGEVKSIEEIYVSQTNWFNRLFQDREFTNKVVARYKQLRKGLLSEENLLRLVDENVAYLGDAVDRNFDLWGYTFKERLLSLDEQGNSRDPNSFEEAIEQLKRIIKLRGEFLDENIEMLYQYESNTGTGGSN